MDDQSQARFRHALQTLSKPRDVEGMDCLPPQPPAVATASQDGNSDHAFIRFCADHPKVLLTLTCTKEEPNVLQVWAESAKLRTVLRVNLIGLELGRGFFPTIPDILRAIERQLFKDKPDA
jgi:hypothetical protein